eukprot:sb/3468559/
MHMFWHSEEPRTSEIAMPQFMHSAQNSKDGFSPAPANKYKECESTIHHGAWLGEEVKRTDYMLLNVTILFILSAIIMGIVFFSLWDELLDEIWILYLGFFITLILVASALAFVRYYLPRLHFYLKSRGYNLLLRTGLELEYHKVVGSTPPQDPKDHGHHGDDEVHHRGHDQEVNHHGNEEVLQDAGSAVESETLVAETQLVYCTSVARELAGQVWGLCFLLKCCQELQKSNRTYTKHVINLNYITVPKHVINLNM